MSELGYFLLGISFCSFIILTVIVIIHKRFRIMMIDLCEGEARANFWTLAVEAWFFIYSVSAALHWRPDGTAERQFFLASICQIKEGLNGMSNSIIMFSVGLLAFVFLRKFRGRDNELLEKEKV